MQGKFQLYAILFHYADGIIPLQKATEKVKMGKHSSLLLSYLHLDFVVYQFH